MECFERFGDPVEWSTEAFGDDRETLRTVVGPVNNEFRVFTPVIACRTLWRYLVLLCLQILEYQCAFLFLSWR